MSSPGYVFSASDLGGTDKQWMTLVIHPGPPGDAGPSSLDWVLMGDTGLSPSSADTLAHLSSSAYSLNPNQRSHWGTICFQANE